MTNSRTGKCTSRCCLLISLVLVACVTGAPAQEPNAVATRFGALSVSEAGVLLFQSVPVRPTIEANNSLDLSQPYQIGASDVVLVTDNGGTACPALYYFVTVTTSGVRVTPSGSGPVGTVTSTSPFTGSTKLNPAASSFET